MHQKTKHTAQQINDLNDKFENFLTLQSVFEKKLTNILETQHAMKQELFVIRNSNIVHDVSKTNDNISTPVQKSSCVPVIVPREPPVPRGRASDHSHSAEPITHSSQTVQSS